MADEVASPEQATVAPRVETPTSEPVIGQPSTVETPAPMAPVEATPEAPAPVIDQVDTPAPVADAVPTPATPQVDQTQEQPVVGGETKKSGIKGFLSNLFGKQK